MMEQLFISTALLTELSPKSCPFNSSFSVADFERLCTPKEEIGLLFLKSLQLAYNVTVAVTQYPNIPSLFSALRHGEVDMILYENSDLLMIKEDVLTSLPTEFESMVILASPDSVVLKKEENPHILTKPFQWQTWLVFAFSLAFVNLYAELTRGRTFHGGINLLAASTASIMIICYGSLLRANLADTRISLPFQSITELIDLVAKGKFKHIALTGLESATFGGLNATERQLLRTAIEVNPFETFDSMSASCVQLSKRGLGVKRFARVTEGRIKFCMDGSLSDDVAFTIVEPLIVRKFAQFRKGRKDLVEMFNRRLDFISRLSGIGTEREWKRRRGFKKVYGSIVQPIAVHNIVLPICVLMAGLLCSIIWFSCEIL